MGLTLQQRANIYARAVAAKKKDEEDRARASAQTAENWQRRSVGGTARLDAQKSALAAPVRATAPKAIAPSSPAPVTSNPGLPARPSILPTAVTNAFRPITITTTETKPAQGRGPAKVETRVETPSERFSAQKDAPPPKVRETAISAPQEVGLGRRISTAIQSSWYDITHRDPVITALEGGPQAQAQRAFQQSLRTGGILGLLAEPLINRKPLATPEEIAAHPIAAGAGSLLGAIPEIAATFGAMGLAGPFVRAAAKEATLQGGKRILANAGIEGAKGAIYGLTRGAAEAATGEQPTDIPGIVGQVRDTVQGGVEWGVGGAVGGALAGIVGNTLKYLQGTRDVSAARTYLGVGAKATDAELKTAARDLLRASHPDTGGSHEAFIAAQQAIPEAINTIKGGRVTPGFWQSVFGEGMTPPVAASTVVAPPARQPIGELEGPLPRELERVQAPPPRETPVRGIAPPEAVTGRVGAPVLMNPPRVRAEVVAPARPAGPAPVAKTATPAPGEVKAWEMNRDELAAAYDEARAYEDNADVQALGEKGAQEWRRLQRQFNSTDSTVVSKAQGRISEIEATLTPDQERLLYGIGETRPSAESLKDALDAVEYIETADSPAELSRRVGRALTQLGGKTDVSKMDSGQRRAYTQLAAAARVAQERGYDANKVIEDAFKSAGKEIGDPQDIELMLGDLWKARTGPAPKSLPAPAAGKGKGGPLEVDEKVVMHSPHTGEDIIVNYRGKINDTATVVFDNGHQLSIPYNWLRRQGEPLVETKAIAKVNPPAPAPVVESAERPVPTTKEGLVAELLGKPPADSDYRGKLDRAERTKSLMKNSKADLAEMVKKERESASTRQRIYELSKPIYDELIKSTEKRSDWRAIIREKAESEGIDGKRYGFAGQTKAEAAVALSRHIAERRLANPSPAPVAPAKSAEATGEKVTSRQVGEGLKATAEESVEAALHTIALNPRKLYKDNAGNYRMRTGLTATGPIHPLNKILKKRFPTLESLIDESVKRNPDSPLAESVRSFDARKAAEKPVPTVPRKNAAVAKEAKKRVEATPAPEVNTPFRPAVSDFGEKNTLVTKSEADAALERVLRKTGRLSANIDPTVIKDMAKVGAYYIEGGIRQFGDWAAKMRGHFGKDAEPYLRRIYTLSNGNLSKLRKFPQSVKDAPIAPAELTEKINENPPTYEPISNEATLQAAQARINADITGGFTTWRDIIAKQKMTAEDVAVGEDLIRRAINEGRIDEANLLTTELAEMLTQAGQTVQAASMIKRMTPEGMLVFAKRSLDRANALLPEKAKTANLSDVDAARIVNLMKRKAELAVEGDLDAFVRKYEELIQSKEFTPSQTRALRLILKRDVLNASDRDAALTAFRKRIDDVLTARVMQIIADAHPVTFGDRLRALQRISMLLNPKTVLSRNVLGNVLMNAVTNFSETLAIPIDVAVKVFTKKSTTTAPSLTTQGGAFAKGVRNVVDDIRLGVDTSPSRTQFELPQGRVFHSNFWNGLDQVVRRGLTFGDRPFYEAAYEEALRQYMRTNSLTEATVEAREYATRVAQIKTYVDTNTISEAFEGLRNTLNGDPTGRKGTKFGFGNIVLPFTKTPANILARALDFSVGGAVRTARAAGLKRGGGFDQRAFVKNLSQTLTGAGLIIAGYTLASMGMLRGAPEKKKRKEQFLRATGKSPYSYYVGGYSYTYDWAQPASFLIAMGANMHQTGVSKEDATTRVTEAIIAGGDTLFNMSVMQGLRGLVGYGSVVEGLMKTAMDTPLQAVPTVTGQTARAIDSTMRMTYSPSELDSVMRKMKARVPFLSRTLQPRINIRGEKALYAGGAFAQYLSPANIAKIEEGAVDKEILRLYAITGDSEVFPRAVQPRFSYEKKEYILTPEQYTKFQQLVGTTTYIGLARIFSESSYKLNDEQGRADMAQKVVRAAYNSAKAHILSEEYGITVGSSSGPPKPPKPPSPPKPPGRAY